MVSQEGAQPNVLHHTGTVLVRLGSGGVPGVRVGSERRRKSVQERRGLKAESCWERGTVGEVWK